MRVRRSRGLLSGSQRTLSKRGTDGAQRLERGPFEDGAQLKQKWTVMMTGKTGDHRDRDRQRREQATEGSWVRQRRQQESDLTEERAGGHKHVFLPCPISDLSLSWKSFL